MSINHDIKWKEYTISILSSSSLRRFLSILPYFPSETIYYNLKLKRHKKTFDKRVTYEWQLIKSIDKTVVDNHGGKGEIIVPRFNPFVLKKEAISLGQIEKGQYKVQLMLGNVMETSPFTDILEVTVKSDELENRIIWVTGGAAIIASIAAMVLVFMN